MRLLKLTAILGFNIVIASCEQELNTTILSNKDVILDGNQVVPAKPSAANGTMDLSYNRSTRILTYTVRWNSLTGVPTAMHIHGPAGVGFAQLINPAAPTAPYWIQNFTSFASSQTGTYNGTLLIDGTAVKEDELLRGGYYLDLHTAANSVSGEIRGQIIVK